MLQRGRAPRETVSVVLTTHETEAQAIKRALQRIAQLESVIEPPRVLEIAEF